MSSDNVGFIVASHEGPRWDMDVGRSAIFKLLSDQTGGEIAVFEEIAPPQTRAPLHIHHTSDEVIYVLYGQFSVRLGEKTHVALADSWIFIPRGSVHGWRNSGAQDGRLLCIFTPAAGARAVEELRHQAAPLPDISPNVRDKIFAQHGFEVVTREWD
ncbi:MAG TPA: cupin domain-containing protein [Roseiarcus sp.]|jgi:quercetin dioxygenase-like cupin family protein